MRIIASDFDGTLSHNGIDDAKRATIAKWQAAGNLFGLISGRGILSLLDMVRQFDLKLDFLLANNGAVLAKPDGTILRDDRADGSILPQLLKVLFEQDCLYAFIDGAQHLRVFPDETQAKQQNGYTQYTVPMPRYFNQVSTRHDSRSAEVTQLLRQMMGERINPLLNGACIDIVSVKMNKAQGIYTLLDYLGADKKDVITVGDQTNDLDMIAEFYSYAMQHGHPLVKQAANFEVGDVTELIERELLR